MSKAFQRITINKVNLPVEVGHKMKSGFNVF